MYHRYMPTENGQYQRKTMPDSHPSPPPVQRKQSAAAPQEQENRSTARQSTAQPLPEVHADRKHEAPEKEPMLSGTQGEKHTPRHDPPGQNHIPILEKLLPGMDSGDVLVLLILLFLISEGNEDSSSVIMTLAIFLFLQ